MINVKELKYDEVDELLDVLTKYEPKEIVVDANFKEVEPVEDIEQVTLI